MTQAPTQIGHFRIERILGRGGMGVVYLARDERLGRAVALKLLSDVELPDEPARERFLREARVAASLKHPNIATVYEVGNEGDKPWIAMEYCEGEALSTRIFGEPFTADEFLSVAEQLASGLAAAHRGNVVHRDIKSANIILEPNGSVKILDFGLAKLVEHDLATSHHPTMQYTSSGGAFFGTVPYISPEQAVGLPADSRSDLFSTGIVLYELATGKLPFDADSPLAVLARIRESEPTTFVPKDPNFPYELANVISRLLQKSPDDRFASADELHAELSRIRARHFATVKKAKPPGPTKTISLKRTVRRKAAIPLIAAATLLLITLGMVWYFRESIGGATAPVSRTIAGPIRSIAVLPFLNLSGSGDDAFLSVGMADTLVTRLQQIQSLHVRPTSAVLEFQNSSFDTKEAGVRLKVDGVLEGRFLTSGQTVRVNMQLTDSRTGYGIWAESIDGNRRDLLSLMDRVSTKAVEALNRQADVASGPAANASEARTANSEAFELYLRARASSGAYDQATYDKQVEILREAVALDPKFAAAYAELAIVVALGQVRGLSDGKVDGRTGEWFARQAVRLDPNLPEAHLALGRTLVRTPNRFRESVRENLAALRLNPNEQQALYTIVTYFISTGELSRAECLGDRFVRANPTSNDARTRGYWYINAVDPERAQELASEALSSNETQLAGFDMLALSALARGDITAAEAAQKRAAAIAPKHYVPKSLLAMIAAARNDRRGVERAVASMSEEIERNHFAALRVALSYAKLGDVLLATKWIQKTATLGNHSWYFMVRHPWLQPLQSDPEFQKVIVTLKQELDDVHDDVIGIYDQLCDRRDARAT